MLARVSSFLLGILGGVVGGVTALGATILGIGVFLRARMPSRERRQ